MTRTRRRVFFRAPGWPELMSEDVVRAYLGDISRTLFWRWRREAGFPSPIAMPGVRRWSRRTVDRWIERLETEGWKGKRGNRDSELGATMEMPSSLR